MYLLISSFLTTVIQFFGFVKHLFTKFLSHFLQDCLVNLLNSSQIRRKFLNLLLITINFFEKVKESSWNFMNNLEQTDCFSLDFLLSRFCFLLRVNVAVYLLQLIFFFFFIFMTQMVLIISCFNLKSLDLFFK